MVWSVPKAFLAASFVGTAIGGVILLKDYMGGKSYNKKCRIDGRTVIVTGANTGIGKETARELAKRGARVYLACRDMDRCEDARREIVLESQNKYVYCRTCDLSSQESIRKFVKKFQDEEKELHILINNAGVMRCPRTLTKEGIELQLGVNHMGHFLLTNLLLDTLKHSAPSRIVNVSSIAHRRGKINFDDLNSEKSYDPGTAYNQSKLANVLFTRELAKRLQGSRVTTNSLHPGVVNTELGRHMGLAKSYISSFFLKPVIWLFLKTPRQGAQTTLFVALDESLNDVSGKYFSNLEEEEVSKEAADDEAGRRLWAISERWTRLTSLPEAVAMSE